MDGSRNYHTQWSKSDSERQISYDIAYLCNLKEWFKQTCLQNRNGVTDVENKLVVTEEKERMDILGDWGW